MTSGEPYQSVIKKCLVADARQRIKTATELISYFERPDETPVIRVTNINENDFETHVLNKDPVSQVSCEAEIPKAVGNENETQLLERNSHFRDDIPTSSQENEVQNKQGKPTSPVKRYGMITAVVLFLICCVFGLVYYLSKFRTADQDVYSSVGQLYKQKKYDAILSTLKDSVKLQSADISVNAVNHYTRALLGKGDTLAAIPYITKSVGSGSTDFTYLLGELYFTGKH